MRNELFGHTNTSTGVGRKVDSWDPKPPRKLRALVEELVFLRSERADLESDVVGNDDEPTAAWILRGLGSNEPADHTDVIGARLAVDLS